MTNHRWRELMVENEGGLVFVLTQDEIKEGWHYCAEFDCLLVGPGMGELACCSCLPQGHTVYQTIPWEDLMQPITLDDFNPPETQSPDPR
jgi:hypothetical protein